MPTNASVSINADEIPRNSDKTCKSSNEDAATHFGLTLEISHAVLASREKQNSDEHRRCAVATGSASFVRLKLQFGSYKKINPDSYKCRSSN